ncbi:spore coat protein YsxE [Bacillus sp. FJAT-49732]|uniref:Spore coat protein YsxE n=1 Tax=Lederbergia citrisecunda TaxID=2833583 RepID=A0A942TQ20_9BACI|nr:spore coat protein YsxE [Lederbergia citrisecunda]MBS4199829.1 spore coat protein YsxE [Lederbergia citrisecunda]
MTSLTSEDISSLIYNYGLSLNFVEKQGRVYKVYTNKGEYALKQMEANKGLDFLRYVQQLYQRGYNRIVPIYPTLDGRYAILEGNSLFYLMPWLENKEREGRLQKHKELFRELARLHTLSVREVSVTKEMREEHYEQTTSRWENEQEALADFVERSEKTVYMSPFQLLFCTFYTEINGAERFALNKLKEWQEATNEETKARSVIIHGKLSNEHFLYNENGIGYFTNFEQAQIASPIHDLLPFLDRTLSTHPKRFDESLEWLDTYFRHFPFKKEEMLLFLSYLAHPGAIFRVVERYFSTGKEKNEMKLVNQLQHQYWRMKNTEYVVVKLEEKERMKNEQQTPPSN